FVVTFKPGKEMEERVLHLEAEEAKRKAQADGIDHAANDSSSIPTQVAENDSPSGDSPNLGASNNYQRPQQG
ncbi:MAG: hypothetical protein NXI22_22330, partial [bacterium]|nr:hypothetical protein [bacterium]